MTQQENPWVEGFKTIGLAVVLAVGLRTFVAEARYIPSESMLPTLQVNDRLIIDKLSYRFKEPQRGDVIVFRPPAEAGRCLNPQAVTPVAPRDAFIKRIIGMPGDTLQVTEEKVYINNQVLDEKYLHDFPNYEFGPKKVPDDSYLVLGDNRNNSCDGHHWGYVPRENIIGKAVVRFWPLNRLGGLDETPIYPSAEEKSKDESESL